MAKRKGTKKDNKVNVGKYSLDILPSGKLRLRKMYKGETYTFTFEKKPTEKELLQILSAELENAQIRKTQKTFKTAAEDYIELKRNVLSPSTIREYKYNINRFSEEFKGLRLSEITALDVQKEVNNLAKTLAPKTVRNYYGFISAILGTFRPNLVLRTTLPQKIKREPYIPSDEDIKRILKAIEDTEFEVAIILGCYGLRRSEICGADPDKDLIGNTLHINHVLVKDENENWVLKAAAKTEESSRTVILPPLLVEKIRKQGYIYMGHPGNITKHLHLLQDKLGIPRFPLHKLRHYFASKMSELGVPEADILKMGGWSTDHVMKTVYRHSLMTKKAQQAASDKLTDALFS